MPSTKAFFSSSLWKHTNNQDVAFRPIRIVFEKDGIYIKCEWWNIVSSSPKDWFVTNIDSITIRYGQEADWHQFADSIPNSGWVINS